MMDQTTADMTNLILGAVQGLEFDHLQPFMRSLKTCGYRGDLCLFVSGVSRRTAVALRDAGARLIRFHDPALPLPGGRKLHLHSRALAPLRRWYLAMMDGLLPPGRADLRAQRRRWVKPFLGVWCRRYLMYHDYLSRHVERYQRVMISDVRDVIFQRHPFEQDLDGAPNRVIRRLGTPAGVCCFLEDAGKTIGQCRCNSAWLASAFGDEARRELSDRLISCSGITLGSSTAMLGYLRTMTDHLTSLRHHVGGIDQGVHNYLVHHGLIEGLRLIANGQGPVLTLGNMPASAVRFNEQGLVLDVKGGVAAVLHQYDRQPEPIRRRILERWSD